MSLDKAIAIGVASNELSKQLTGTDQVCAKRSAVAVGTGMATGAMLGTGVAALSVVAAPITLPLAISAGIFAGVASLFGDRD